MVIESQQYSTVINSRQTTELVEWVLLRFRDQSSGRLSFFSGAQLDYTARAVIKLRCKYLCILSLSNIKRVGFGVIIISYVFDHVLILKY